MRLETYTHNIQGVRIIFSVQCSHIILVSLKRQTSNEMQPNENGRDEFMQRIFIMTFELSPSDYNAIKHFR